MDFTQVASQLWPCWLLGVIMMFLTLNSRHKKLLRINTKAVFKFVKILVAVCILRFVFLKLSLTPDAIESLRATSDMIPIGAIFAVPWEDACHALPLVLLALVCRKKKWYPVIGKLLLGIVMIAFGAGHLYQGLVPAMLLSLYIPATMKLGIKYGFGTIMISHIMYDLSTLLMIRMMFG